jgi:hypothetical protein
VTLTLRAKDGNGADLTAGGLTVAFSASGGTSTGTISATTDHGDGTYTAIYTGTVAGTAQSIGATIDGVAVTTTKPTVTVLAANTYQTPDIVNNESFETGWGPFTNWSGGVPTNVTRDDALASSGSWSLLRSIGPTPSGDGGAQLTNHWSGTDRVWVRAYFRLTAHVTTIWKWSRVYDPSFDNNMGGLFVGQGTDIFTWGWDAENSAITTEIGLSEGQVIDGNWHSLEYDYWRNGDPSGWPSVAFWFDGNPLAKPDGAYTKYSCLQPSPPSTCNRSYWSGGRLHAGERASDRQGVKLGTIEWLGTLNQGNTSTGECRLDRIAVSSLGRIGP